MDSIDLYKHISDQFDPEKSSEGIIVSPNGFVSTINHNQGYVGGTV